MEHVLVLRLDALRLVRYTDAGSLAALTPGGAVLATVPAPPEGADPIWVRETVAELYELVLSRGRVRRVIEDRDGTPVLSRVPVVLYDPYSFESAYGPVPSPTTSSNTAPAPGKPSTSEPSATCSDRPPRSRHEVRTESSAAGITPAHVWFLQGPQELS